MRVRGLRGGEEGRAKKERKAQLVVFTHGCLILPHRDGYQHFAERRSIFGGAGAPPERAVYCTEASRAQRERGGGAGRRRREE